MQIKNISEENMMSLLMNTTSFASAMLKKEDKVRMLMKACQLYYSEGYVCLK